MAQKKEYPHEKIGVTVSQLIDWVGYMADVRGISGHFFPRKLAEIAATRRGDCKDMVVSVGAILTKLGFEVHPALIQRGGGYAISDGGHAELLTSAGNRRVYVKKFQFFKTLASNF